MYVVNKELTVNITHKIMSMVRYCFESINKLNLIKVMVTRD